ncbi:hypothetical protein PHYBOEH_011259 [Phytophthora boehmeriae]|uniref:RxLR effector protein n=1 Tax=Phytophthora boehmeriae TaxID=109152 RepID=A0A8T1WYK4_9STRA|nr:hypothetical protein PHYBOEH_011259 [Phytophthora boehmeriae]
MRLSYFLVVTTATMALASGIALPTSEQSAIAKMTPTHGTAPYQDRNSGGRRLLRPGDDVDVEERAWNIVPLKYYNMLKNEAVRERQFEKWFEKGVQAVKAEKKMLRFAVTKKQKEAFKELAGKYAKYRKDLSF